jgi:hypothetical protein
MDCEVYLDDSMFESNMYLAGDGSRMIDAR